MKKQAKLTSKTKYYAADVPQFFKAANFGENYSYYKVKHLRKLTCIFRDHRSGFPPKLIMYSA